MGEVNKGLEFDPEVDNEKKLKYNIPLHEKMFYLQRVVSGMEDLKGDKKIIFNAERGDNQKGIWRGWDTPERNKIQKKIDQRAEEGLIIFEQLKEGKTKEIEESIEALKK